jgi:U3 small nucleolar RNA-associated protein 19
MMLQEENTTLAKSLTLYFLDRYHAGDIFVPGVSAPLDTLDEPKAVFVEWMTRMKDNFVSELLGMVWRASAPDQVAAVSCLMEFVRGQTLGVFDHELYLRILKVVLKNSGVASETVGVIIEKYCLYADAHYFTCKGVAWLCARHDARRVTAGDTSSDEDDSEEEREEETKDSNSVSSNDFLRTVYDVMIHITDRLNEFQDDDLASWCGASEVGILAATNDGSTKRQRKRMRDEIGGEKNANKVSGKWSSRKLRQKALSDAWISFLKLQVPFDCYRSLLTRLHNTIIPSLINPLLLSDFLTHALDRGGLDGMLALNGIFILVTQHGLEYPKFYERLYGLLDSDVFISKHRVRFFQLADIFLASPMVPAYTAAAFAKKFARLGMRGSPATAIIAIAFIHNIIRRHPSCVQILHRPRPDGATVESLKSKGEVWQGIDVYDENETDPAQSRALESTLWELSVFKNHADASVAQYCTVLDKDLTNKLKSAEIDISEVLSASYASMFDREINKRLKNVPTAIYAGSRSGVPKHLFPEETFSASFPGFAL